MTLRYIGSKARIASAIVNTIGAAPAGAVFVDAMAGTGAVASAAADAGWRVRVNDHLLSSQIVATANLVGCDRAAFGAFRGYDKALELLNATPPRQGFMWREYSPASAERAPKPRLYFTSDNAEKLDGIREQIRQWSTAGAINESEECVLLADLLAAASRVANIAGTYGCFLSTLAPNARQRIRLVPRVLRQTTAVVSSHCVDVLDVPSAADDVVYYDPPYTKRQYAAYYHVSETIAHGDEPAVTGITGLRPWEHLSSDFCHRRRALAALTDAIQNCPANTVCLSYSDDGHIAPQVLRERIGELGVAEWHELGEIGRYRPNTKSRHRSSVIEYLLIVRKPRQDAVTAALHADEVTSAR